MEIISNNVLVLILFHKWEKNYIVKIILYLSSTSSPTLDFYSSSRKGWFTLDLTLDQDIKHKIYSLIHLYSAGFKVSTTKLWEVEEQNSKKQITLLLSVKSTRVFFAIILKGKTKLTFPCKWYSQITQYMWYFCILTKALISYVFS